MFIKVIIQTKILCFKLNFYVFNKCVNKPLQNGYSSEGTISPDVLGHPLLTVSNTDPVFIKFLCHQQMKGNKQKGHCHINSFCPILENKTLVELTTYQKITFKILMVYQENFKTNIFIPNKSFYET